jgi:hypothetical protein
MIENARLMSADRVSGLLVPDVAAVAGEINLRVTAQNGLHIGTHCPL